MTFADACRTRSPASASPSARRRFLVTVMLHAGVCLGRQYCAFAGSAHGQKTRDFFRRPGGEASRHRLSVWAHKARVSITSTTRRCTTRSANRTIAIANRWRWARHRTPDGARRRARRASPDWLATEHDKVAHFTLTTTLRRDELPQLVVRPRHRADRPVLPRQAADRLASRRPHARVPVRVHRAAPGDFRVFLHRHANPVRALSRWTLRLLVAPHLAHRGAATINARLHEELGVPLRPGYGRRTALVFPAAPAGHDGSDEREHHGCTEVPPRPPAFGAPRFRVLYRHWLLDRRALDQRAPFASAGGRDHPRHGQVETHVLTRRITISPPWSAPPDRKRLTPKGEPNRPHGWGVHPSPCAYGEVVMRLTAGSEGARRYKRCGV